LLYNKTPQPHEKTGRNQYRNDRHKYVTECAYCALEHISPRPRFFFNFLFTFSFQAELEHFLICPVDRPGSQYHLELPGIVECTFDFVDILYGILVDLLLVTRDNPKTGGTMGNRLNVVLSAGSFNDFLCDFAVYSHYSTLLFICSIYGIDSTYASKKEDEQNDYVFILFINYLAIPVLSQAYFSH